MQQVQKIFFLNKTIKPKKFYSFAPPNYERMTSDEKIINSALEAFKTNGIKNVTMDDIAKRAGVSKRTVYELFNDKHTLVIASIKHMLIKNNCEIIKIIGQTDNVIEALFKIVEAESLSHQNISPNFMSDIQKYFPIVSASLTNNLENWSKFSAGYHFLEKGIEQGVIRGNLNIQLVDNFLHEMINLVHNSQIFKIMNLEKDDILDNIFLPYFRGICTSKGLKLMEKHFEKKTDQ
jgi:AcrR family transcriptional regulator